MSGKGSITLTTMFLLALLIGPSELQANPSSTSLTPSNSATRRIVLSRAQLSTSWEDSTRVQC